MFVPNFQSRSSIDSGASKPHTSTTRQPASARPLRLQHSPSLPNIWFPPHSRPALPNMSSTAQNDLINWDHSSTPPAIASHSPPTTPQNLLPKPCDDEIVSAVERLSVKSNDTRRSFNKATGLHTHKRQRKDAPHLLTPPLTPSSSVRTTASAESTDGNQDDKVQALQELQEPDATRFLYLENVSRSVSPAPLQNAITDALSHISSRRSLKRTSQTSAMDDPTRETSCIKGFFLRHLNTTGTLFLAFHDIRDALVAKATLSETTDGVLAEYLGEAKSRDGAQGWFRCRFITAEELVKTIGNSNFLATTDGGFSLSVAVIDRTHTGETQSHGSNISKQGINMDLLVKILESYGDLRLLKPESQVGDGESFLVEFFDVRDAKEAYTSLNEQIMFGMKLSTSGRVPQDFQENDDIRRCKTGHDRSDTPQSSHQLSASESHIPKLRPEIGPAGEASHMRGRFVSQPLRSRPRAVSVGNETTCSPPPPPPFDGQPKASSPTIFYTSCDVTDPYSTSSRTLEGSESDPNPAHDENCLPETSDVPVHWEPQQTCTTAECRYCPSKGHELSAVQPHFSGYFNPPFVNTVPFPGQPLPPAFTVSNEHEPQGMFPGTSWPFDPSMMVPNVGNSLEMFTPPFIPAIPVVPAEHRYPDQNTNPNFVPNGLVFPVVSHGLHMQPHAVVEPHPAIAPDRPIFVNNPTDSSDLDVTCNLPTTGPSVSDRNYLNIARIEEGLDTRTTVMIKNIPNKMTAKDLIDYINEVCPRKIDFLYLRMDFKNGCNVGYAFVNFIRVHDMLKFAKKRLGVKWNMFSSEKVLQMSYANYQGKEALVEKFKNSSIMDEREEWRPKIFYSSGPEQGLPEPFPAPTHLRRKERSSHNRGALYVPGTTGGSTSGSGYLNNSPLRRQEYHSATGSKYLEHRNRHMDKIGGGGRTRDQAPYERSH